MAFRAFVAVPVPPLEPLVGLLDAIAAAGADARPVEPTQLHFTLSFLGDVADEATPRIVESLEEAARGSPPFRVSLRAVGAFPSARRPRVVWAGVADPRPLVALALRVREELAKVGAPADDKDFRAHLTLARVRSERGSDEVVSFLKRHGNVELPTTRVEDMRLYRSVLGPDGPTYEALEAAPLVKEAA